MQAFARKSGYARLACRALTVRGSQTPNEGSKISFRRSNNLARAAAIVASRQLSDGIASSSKLAIIILPAWNLADKVGIGLTECTLLTLRVVALKLEYWNRHSRQSKRHGPPE